jgi:hypothetical protein
MPVPPPVITAIFPAKSFMASLTCDLLLLGIASDGERPKSTVWQVHFPALRAKPAGASNCV